MRARGSQLVERGHMEAALRMIERAVTQRRPAPSNVMIAQSLGFASSATASRIIALLERERRITVERFQSSRRIALADGRATVLPQQRRRGHSHAGQPLPSRTAAAPPAVSIAPPLDDFKGGTP